MGLLIGIGILAAAVWVIIYAIGEIRCAIEQKKLNDMIKKMDEKYGNQNKS